MRRILFAASLLLLPTVAWAGLSPREAELAGKVSSTLDEALPLLEESVNTNSGTQNHAGIRAVGEIFAPRFAALGFEVEWVDGRAFDRAGHLLARRPGEGPGVLLIGHLDTVFEPQDPFQRYEREGSSALGPGTTDMKGGIVVMLMALEGLHALGELDGLDLRVVLTGDEEAAGRPLVLARQALRDAAEGARYALGFEDGDGDPASAVVSRRGASSWTLETTGTVAHSSQVFAEGVGAGAIHEAARILEGFRVRLADRPDLTCSPGLILGGSELTHEPWGARGHAFGKNNVIPARALVTGDLRSVSPAQLARARATMDSIVSASLPGCAATIRYNDGYPPMAPTPGNLELLTLYSRASEDLGHGPVRAVRPRDAGAADISFVATQVDMALDGLGLMGSGGHTNHERADLDTLVPQAQRAALLLYRLPR